MTQEDVQFMESLQDAMQQPENSYMTDRINHKIIYRISNQLCQILEQGNDEKVFSVDHPEEVASYLMTAFTFVMNDHYFHKNDMEKTIKYFAAFVEIINKTLNPIKPILKSIFE